MEKKIIALICLNLFDFKSYLKKNKINTKITECGKFESLDSVYCPIISELDLCSYQFNEIIETEKSKDNPKYSLIKRDLISCIIS